MKQFPKIFMGRSHECVSSGRRGIVRWQKASQQDVINEKSFEEKGFASAEIASDHYHHYKEDVALMAEMGFSTYRFSISWSRVFPDGVGEVNEKGIEFYRN